MAAPSGQLSASYRRVIFTNVSTVFQAAVDDGLIRHNPCRSGSVTAPKADIRRVDLDGQSGAGRAQLTR